MSESSDPEERAHAENFLWDERPPAAGIDLYGGFVKHGPIINLDDWTNRHRNYATEHLYIDRDDSATPWTFQIENDANRLHQIDPRLYLLRVEAANSPCDLLGISTEELRQQMDKYRQGDTGAREMIERFTSTWNERRDKRPMFATTELEVEDIFQDEDDGWAERLRDRLGLGHHSPLPDGPPVEVLVMRYTVAEVLAAAGAGLGDPAIPTVLDCNLSCYFFPSPIPNPAAGANPYYGHTVNLATVENENDYLIGVELLHPRLDYQPEHLFRFGVIARPVTMSLERARSFHLPWVRLYSGRDDFGAIPAGGELP